MKPRHLLLAMLPHCERLRAVQVVALALAAAGLALIAWHTDASTTPRGPLWLEGPGAIAQGLVDAAAVLWQSLGNTLFGYGAWAWLLARHPVATVAPMALLVPVFGMSASALLLSEALPAAWR